MLLKVFYQNIHGLDKAKLKHIDNLLDNEHAIFIIAEHWFCDFQTLTHSPKFICSSTMSSQPRSTGHQNGGLAILASPAIRNLINIIQITEFTISFNIDKQTISGVYLPPSLSLEVISLVLGKIPKSNIVLGDINVRYGKTTLDDKVWNPERGILIDTLLVKQGLQHRICTTVCSRNDHIYSLIPVSWEYQWILPKDFNSDHGRMKFLLDLRPDVKSQQINSRRRYAFSLLKEPIIYQLATDLWNSQSKLRLSELIKALGIFIRMKKVEDRATLQELIDSVYGQFTRELKHICDALFPTYEPNQVKTNVDPSTLLDGQASTTDVIRAFKRSQRSYASSRLLQPRDRSKTAMFEAWDHYQAIYDQTETTEVPSLHRSPMTPGEEMSSDRIRNTLEKYSSAKAGGPDGFDTRFLKCLNSDTSFAVVLEQLFNLFLFTGVTPTTWNVSTIHLLLKDPENPYADKTRPISLTNVLRRIFEKQLLLNWLSKDWSMLNEHQAGFRRGWSTISNILLSDNLSRSGWPISAFLDLKSAFDKVPHNKLLAVLRKRGCDGRTIQLIYSLMMNSCRSILMVNGTECTKVIERHCGVFQGSILSPFLFNLFIDSLASDLNSRSDRRYIALLFADDVVVKAKTRADLQEALHLCYLWAEEHSMSWNIAKCGIMGKSKEQNDLVSNDLTLGGNAIPEVSSYKYLGLPHGATGISWKLYCEQIVSKHNGILMATIVRRKAWLLHTRLTVYKVFIRPTLEYCLAPLWTWTMRQKAHIRDYCRNLLLDSHSQALSWLFDTPRPRQILENVSGLGDFESRIEMLQGSVANHLQNMDAQNPLSKHMRAHPISSSRNFILQTCIRSPLLDSWRTQPKDLTWVSWQTWNRRNWVQKQLDSTTILPHYILMRCRAGSFMDRFLGQSLILAKQALAWRSNRLFSRAKCPECFQPFNRAHLRRCNLYKNLGIHANVLDHDSFKADHDRISQTLKDHKRVFHYTVLDYYLNNQEYDGFSSIVAMLRTLLHGESES